MTGLPPWTNSKGEVDALGRMMFIAFGVFLGLLAAGAALVLTGTVCQ